MLYPFPHISGSSAGMLWVQIPEEPLLVPRARTFTLDCSAKQIIASECQSNTDQTLCSYPKLDLLAWKKDLFPFTYSQYVSKFLLEPFPMVSHHSDQLYELHKQHHVSIFCSFQKEVQMCVGLSDGKTI